MAIALSTITVNHSNNILHYTKPAGIRDAINAWITKHNGVVPDQFMSLNELGDLYTAATKLEKPDHVNRHLIIGVYQAYTWLYSRWDAKLDMRLRCDIITTQQDKVFHGEALRRLPEWTTRVEIAYLAEDAVEKKPLGVDMLVSRAIIDGIDAVIIRMTIVAQTTTEADKEDDIEFRDYVLDISKKSVLSAALAMGDWNVDPVTGAPFDPDQIKMLERFMPGLMFVCSQMPAQPKSQGHIQHQNVKVKKKGKGWVLVPANKLNRHEIGYELADALIEDEAMRKGLLPTEPYIQPAEHAKFIGEWDDPDAEDPTFHLDWIPPVYLDEKNEEETPL